MLTRANPSLELHTLDIWWHGPAFIFDDSITVSEELIDIFINVFFLRGPEGSAVTSSNMLKVASAGDDLLSTSLPEIHRFSDFQKLMRVTSYVLRFISKCRKISRFSGCIKIPELVNAENLWLKSVQSAYYKDVVSYFVNKGVKQEKIPFLVKQLRLVFVDGFIRINTRLANSDLDFNIKCPILLPPQSHFVTLLIMHTHLRNKHDSAANVVISLRQMYWITKCRQTVKKIIHSCLTCKRFAANRYSIPRTPALPDIRVNESRPFQFTGVDLTGFIRVKAHSGVIKIYIVLFTCCVSRAVHLEIVDSVSAESFAFAFRRFISRRGLPQIMLSDNATNFIGHETLLKKLYEMAYNSDLFNSFKVEWKFIPPRSPHVGGMWERLIGMMKTLLKKSLGRSMVSLDEFSTILIEIEGRMNDRPLIYVDAESLDIISPSSLMFGHRLDSLPYNLDYDTLYDEQEGSLTTKYKRVLKILHYFWLRWAKEYLPLLKEQEKVTFPGKKGKIEPKIGDVVLLVDETLPPSFWQLGRVVELFIGNDGESRFARLKTKNGFVGRPLFKLRFLECATPRELDSNMPSNASASTDDINVHNLGRVRRAAATDMLRRLQQWKANDSV